MEVETEAASGCTWVCLDEQNIAEEEEESNTISRKELTKQTIELW